MIIFTLCCLFYFYRPQPNKNRVHHGFQRTYVCYIWTVKNNCSEKNISYLSYAHISLDVLRMVTVTAKWARLKSAHSNIETIPYSITPVLTATNQNSQKKSFAGSSTWIALLQFSNRSIRYQRFDFNEFSLFKVILFIKKISRKKTSIRKYVYPKKNFLMIQAWLIDIKY